MSSPRRMERSCTATTGGKRSLQSDEEQQQPDLKRPALASVIVEALKVDSLQKLCSSMEPILRKIVSEEVERALAKLGPARLNESSLSKCIEGPSGRNLQLTFRSRLSLPLFTGAKIEGDQGAAIHIVLIDANSGHVITNGPESSVKLDVVVLEGGFKNEDDEGWTREEFESHVVKEREGRRPLLTGDMQVLLKEGVGTLGEITFTDNSSWIRSRKFRLGLKIAAGFCEGMRIREAKTEAFSVKDHRGELYRKHYPPALTDEVWRLEKIGKDGSFHKKLSAEGIVTVEDFLRLVVRDSQKLRNILGSGMSNRMWEVLIEHAKTCVLSGKHYVYYHDKTRSIGVLFNNIYELSGFISGEQFLSADSLSERQKVYVDSLVKKAYDNWNQVIEYDGKSLLSFSSPTSRNEFSADLSYYQKALGDLSHPAHQLSSVASEQSPVQHSLQVEGYSGDDSNSSRYLGSLNENGVVGFHFTGGGSSEASNQSPPLGEWHDEPPGKLGCDDLFSEEEIRIRSNELLDNEEIQQLLLWSMNGGHQHENGDEYGFPLESYEDGADCSRSGNAAPAGLGWLKIKAAMRWGFFVRRKAAERRAQLQLIEIDDD